MEPLLEKRFHRARREVSPADETFVVLLDAGHPGQADEARVVGEDADDVGPAADLAVEPLPRVGNRYERR
jgi:hypothetical protein